VKVWLIRWPICSEGGEGVYTVVMTSDNLNAALDVRPFEPARLRLADGSAVEVPTPYLSFVNGRVLQLALARRVAGQPLGLDLVPLRDIVAIERPTLHADAVPA
jgi:hypothetical protein